MRSRNSSSASDLGMRNGIAELRAGSSSKAGSKDNNTDGHNMKWFQLMGLKVTGLRPWAALGGVQYAPKL